jgi:hypothetical protein
MEKPKTGTKAKAGNKPRRSCSHHVETSRGQGVHREVESERHEEKYRAVQASAKGTIT